MHGGETELDRQVLELIKDPLTHMIRNSADHGLEAPEERAMCGKPEPVGSSSAPISKGATSLSRSAMTGAGSTPESGPRRSTMACHARRPTA